MAKALAQFTITRTGDDYLLILEDEDGDTTELSAELDQLDDILEAIDEQLALADEEEEPADEADEEDEEA